MPVLKDLLCLFVVSGLGSHNRFTLTAEREDKKLVKKSVLPKINLDSLRCSVHHLWVLGHSLVKIDQRK